MTKQQTVENNQISKFIIETLNTKNPETTNALVKLIQQNYSLPKEEIIAILLQLEAESKIHFTQKIAQTPSKLSAYVFSLKSIWYWLTIAIAIATAIVVFILPPDVYPLVYLRQILGAVFVLFLPGFGFIKALYPSKVPITTSSENLDTIERVTFSIGLSIVLTAIVGLIFNYTSWGIRLTPITFSLLILTIVFATVAVLREYSSKSSTS